MPMSRRRVEVSVGLFMLFGLAALLVSVIFIGQQQRVFERRVRLQTSFTSVQGLQSGAPVYIAGIWVGSVEEVLLAEEGHVLVRMEVREAEFHRIRTDSRARIRTAGLVGDRYIDITVGSADSPALATGDTVTGIDPLDMDEVLAEAGPLFDSFATALENVRTVTERIMNERSDFNVTIENLRIITDNLREGRGTIGRLMMDDAVYEDLRATAASARRVTADAEAVVSNIREETPALIAETRAAVAKIGGAAEQTEEMLERALSQLPAVVERVDRSMADLEVLLANLREASEDIKSATPQLPQIIADGQKAVDETREVLQAARSHPLLRRYFREGGEEGSAPILADDRAGVTRAR